MKTETGYSPDQDPAAIELINEMIGKKKATEQLLQIMNEAEVTPEQPK